MAKDDKEKKDDDEKGGLGGKLKIVGIIVATLAVGYFLFGRGGGAAADAAPTTTIPLEEEAEGAILDVGSLTVNLADETPRYAKIGIAIVLVEGNDPLLAESKTALVLDAVLSEVSVMTAEELLSENGFDTLRQAIGERAIDIYNEEADAEAGTEETRVVKRVVLTELLIQ